MVGANEINQYKRNFFGGSPRSDGDKKKTADIGSGHRVESELTARWNVVNPQRSVRHPKTNTETDLVHIR